MSLLAAWAIMQAAGGLSPYEVITHEEAVRRLSDCEITQFELARDDAADVDSVAITDEELSNVQLACLAYAFDRTGYYLVLPEDRSYAFFEVQQAIKAPRERVAGLAWFAEEGMSEQLTAIDFDALNDAGAAEKIEALCGPLAEGAFTSEYGSLTLAPDWMPPQAYLDEEWMTTFTCVLNGLRISGRPMMFIGNE